MIFFCILGAIIIWVVFSVGYGVGSWQMQVKYTWIWPNIPGCKLMEASRYPSADGGTLATILKRDCDLGEHINYFLRLDIGGLQPGPSGSWVAELENDQYPVAEPTVVWTKRNTVQVTVSTRTLSGTLVVNDGYNTEIVRVYQPREPGALPNYR